MANRKIYLAREQIEKLIDYGAEQELETVDSTRFLKRIIKETNEYELKENSILERGGVAAFPYAGTLEIYANTLSNISKPMIRLIISGKLLFLKN